jgi:hypothetical protein
LVLLSGLQRGTAGMGRVRPRQAASTGIAGRRFFFQNCTLSVSYPCPFRVHGYHGYGGYFFLFLFFFRRVRVRVLIWCEPGGKVLKFEFHRSAGTGTGTGMRSAGKRVQRVFSKKKVIGHSQTRTRLPAYTRARVRVVPDEF